jgi:DNA polymerase (family 10)
VSHHQNEFDIRVALPADRGSTMFRATGPAPHVTAVLSRAGEADFAEEEEIYARAGLVYVPPEVRGTAGALEAAAVGPLPSLIERRHIRGDLHMHSTYSDGLDSMAAMVETCVAIGHEYIAITDHSVGASASRTLAAEEIPRQRDEIAGLRERFPWIAILHGVEVDILPDGRLDFDDRTLEQFDIVLASLHDRAGQDGDRLTSRCVAALRHPLVNVLTHPANRLPGRRGGYPLDYGLLFETAALTGTALEVDGAPGHLDMDGELARAAVAGGATVVIDSDCHRARSLEKQLRFGVGTARRGWVEPRHVLNARSIDEVRAFIKQKRRQ